MKQIERKAFFDFEKEERYLNEMAAQGLALTDYSWCKYVFEETQKGEYIYRIQLLKNPVDHPESQKYIKFMAETGAEFITSYNRWVYFRRKATDGEFEIYTDTDSKIKHYKRIRALFVAVLMLNLIIGLLNWYHGKIEPSLGVPPVNSYVAILSLVVVALLLIFLILPLTKKITLLEKEKAIRE